MPNPAATLLTLAGLSLLLWAALHDIGFRTVPNRVSVALLAIGLLLRATQGDILAGIGCGTLVFVITYTFWRFGWMGGADVKLLTAASVFISPAMVPTLVIGTSLAGGALAAIYLLGGRVVPRPAGPARPGTGLWRRAVRCEQRRLCRRGPLPYAAAIATGGLLAIATS